MNKTERIRNVKKRKNTSDEKEFRVILNSCSQRITAPRLEIMKVLKDNREPLTISEIHSGLKNDRIDLATVYRTIKLFFDLGIVSEIDFKDEFRRYELVYDRDHHHHIVCKKCKRVENIESCVLEELESLLKQRGYSDISHSLEFFGVCEKCRD